MSFLFILPNAPRSSCHAFQAVRRSGKTTEDIVIAEAHLVIAGLANLSLMAESRAIASIGISGGARIQLCLASVRHHQNITHIGMAGAIKVGIAETYTGIVFMLIASAILVRTRLVFTLDIVGNGVRIGTNLHKAERHTGTRECVPHTVGTDDGIHIIDSLLGRCHGIVFLRERN